jgi:hypothetical protein
MREDTATEEDTAMDFVGVSPTEACTNLSDLIASAAYASEPAYATERSIITRTGKPMAAIMVY